MQPCFYAVIDTIGWGWGFVVLSYTWLSFLVVVQAVLVRACCGKLRPLERMQVTKAALRLLWSSCVYVTVVLGPKVR